MMNTGTTNNQTDWPHIKIKRALEDVGIQLKEIAMRAGKSNMAVTKVLKGELRTPRIRKEIAAALGKDVREIWPSGYFTGRNIQ